MTKQRPSFLTDKIRIISGQWRGRKLSVPDSPGLRPTTARVRETLFNWLTPVIRGAHCLDCFAGSGALGLEALSRYAASVVLLEQNHSVSMQLSKNLKLLQIQTQVINVDSLHWLNQPGSMYNVVFIDPPFYRGMIDKTIELLERNHRLSPDAWIYIETAIENPDVKTPAHWQLYRRKTIGRVLFQLYMNKS